VRGPLTSGEGQERVTPACVARPRSCRGPSWHSPVPGARSMPPASDGAVVSRPDSCGHSATCGVPSRDASAARLKQAKQAAELPRWLPGAALQPLGLGRSDRLVQLAFGQVQLVAQDHQFEIFFLVGHSADLHQLDELCFLEYAVCLGLATRAWNRSSTSRSRPGCAYAKPTQWLISPIYFNSKQGNMRLQARESRSSAQGRCRATQDRRQLKP
jgi:hypothetical protein